MTIDYPRIKAASRPGFLLSRRFELLAALLIAVGAPAFIGALRGYDDAIEVTMVSNGIAVLVAFWIRESTLSFPGVSGAKTILPSILATHALLWLALIMLRLEYSRLGLSLGALFHVGIVYVRFLTLLSTRVRFAVVPFGKSTALVEHRNVEWRVLESVTDPSATQCGAIVADFDADLPIEWERFLADASLDGRMVFQAKTLEESLTGRVRLEHLGENNFGTAVTARWWYHGKDLIDRAAAVLILPLALVPMAFIALLIKQDSPGPILFRQCRTGHGGRPFTVYKFRTMTHRQSDGNELIDVAQTQDNDARITAVGRRLRKLRLDELPQLFNVLKGEMSFIGPRPEPTVLTDWYQKDIGFYRYRHVIRPGITGWAQVNQGHVNGLDEAQRKLEYDFFYVKNFSPWLDVVIALKTLVVMLGGRGAR